MSDQEINTAIAEACGWKPRHHAVGYYRDLHTPFIESLHDYCNDLNAMHEAEKILSEKEQRDYSFRLLVALVDGSVTHDLNDHFIYLTATAAQRAEAFLRTLGKWEDAK